MYSLILQIPNDWDLFLHLGQDNPFVRVPHFLQFISIPTIARGDVLVAFIIKIATTRMPTTIAMSNTTIQYIRENKHKEIYKIVESVIFRIYNHIIIIEIF